MLRAVYSHGGKRNPRLVLGPGIGRDAAVVRLEKKLVVLTADPVTGTAKQIGEHSVHINANDIAATGAKPVWYVCTLLLPTGTREKTLARIMKGIDVASRSLGITVAGGHTEVTRGLERPLIAGFMIGETGGRVLSSANMRVGDSILMTKTAGIEGTAILASEYSGRLKGVERKTIQKARSFAKNISIVDEAMSTSKIAGVHALHDPTEGGVLNGLWEMAEASGLGVEVWADRIPVATETSKICSVLRLDPLKLMSSGCLLTAVAQRNAGLVMKALRSRGVMVSEIGRVIPRPKGRFVLKEGKRVDLVAVPQDELYRLT
ncbi:MAG TPA: AIR synthase family protein [Candidatus Angelobacter sp.]|nr:AIR synthase family protein [Candidatus Angelobacter sp.]